MIQVTPIALAAAGPRSPKPFDLGLCLSGGGYRAMLFHAGSLARLNEAGVLGSIDVVGSVSGGSIAAGVLARAWPSLAFQGRVATNFRPLILDPILNFSQRFVDGPSVLNGLVKPFSSAPEEVAAVYDRDLFSGTKLAELPEAPWFIFCASNLNTGSLFRMSQRYVADYRIGIAPPGEMRLSHAVACSSAFPPFLSPLRLDLTPFAWSPQKLDDGVGATVPKPPARAVLTDGGVYDNHGIEPVLKRCKTVLVSDGGAPWRQSESGFRNWFSQLKRVLDTTDNQVRSLRRHDLITAFDAAREAAANGVNVAADPSFTHGCYWSIAPSAKLLTKAPNLQTFLNGCEVRPMDLATVLHFLGERETEAVVNWGYLVTDQALRAHYDTQLPPMIGPPAPVGTVKATSEARKSRALMRLFGF